MQIQIPEELQPYVMLHKEHGLIHKLDMPEELLPLFEKTKKEADEYLRIQKEEKERIKKQAMELVNKYKQGK